MDVLASRPMVKGELVTGGENAARTRLGTPLRRQCILACMLLVILSGCSSLVGPNPPSAPYPNDFVKMANDIGLRPFAFPRSVFEPGTIVQLNEAGDISASPLGSLKDCSVGAPLQSTEGKGFSAEFMSVARNGVRLNFKFLKPFLGFTADLREDTFALLFLSGSYSRLQSKVILQDEITKNWVRMRASCRDELSRPNVAVLTEVFFAAKGSRLQFFHGDGRSLALSSYQHDGITRAMLAAGTESGAGGDIIFEFDLPLMYSVIRPSIVTGCPFNLNVVRDKEYHNCVRRLAVSERDLILAEASGVLRREFADVIKQPKPAYLYEDFANPNAIIAFLQEFDRDNGHALYYEGEIRRWVYKNDRLSEEFMRSHMSYRRYLQISDTLKPEERDGTAEACYNRSRGYCAERTAWIFHQMANDFYRLGLKETQLRDKREYYQQALKHAKNCLEIREQGFDQHISTKELHELLSRAVEQASL